MKKLLTIAFLSVAGAAFAGYQDIKPGAGAEKAPSSVEWENANDAALSAATCDDVLAGFVADEASAMKLLSQVKDAYLTDPLVMCQVAAVSQWVMRPEPSWYAFWESSPAAERKVWVKALIATAEQTGVNYVQMVCLDQLRWCGCQCPQALARIRVIGEKGDKPVKEFAAVVIKELQGKAIGL